ncbi:MAG: Polygalacturonase [Spirochaetes bacterium]|nr:MAG: Polygalacturonase [Spirochaetota bacterium]
MEITIDPPPDRGCGSAAILFSQAFEKIRLAGGGRLRIRDGEYLLGPLDLPGSLTLALDAGATLRFTDDFNAYPPVLTRWEGFECLAMHPLIFAQGARDIRIEGEGTIDGNGYAWWAAHRQKQGKSQAVKVLPADPSSPPSGGGGRETGFLRPPLIQLVECENVVVSGIRIRNSPFWTLHPVFSRRIEFQGLRIENPADAPNTDGIDIDSCEEVRIVDCLVDVGDDCIALKAGSGNQGVEIGRPTRNVTISGCTFRSGHGGVVVGSETAGGVENVAVSNCRFIGTDRGIRIKSRRGRGGLVQNLSFSNLVMDGALAPGLKPGSLPACSHSGKNP